MSRFITHKTKHVKRHLLGDLMPWILTVTVVLIILFSIFRFYIFLTRPNVKLNGKPYSYLFIPSNSSYGDVRKILIGHGYISNIRTFDWSARRMNYAGHIKAGKYKIREGMSNRELLQMLRSGRQEPVKIIITNARNPQEIAGKAGHLLEADSSKLMRLFNDSSFLARFGLNRQTAMVLFIPDTYNFFWNTSPAQFFKRMYREYQKFWQGERRRKCDSLGFSIPEVVTLASIIEKETAKNDEKQIMAGVYINRLRKHIPLQADPTIIFAWNDYTIKRVLNEHLQIDSPYNTYKIAGLPPGPICLPSVASVDAVLNYQKHTYLYFCAREDFSGYHNFVVTLSEHNRNAKRYQEALNKMKIK